MPMTQPHAPSRASEVQRLHREDPPQQAGAGLAFQTFGVAQAPATVRFASALLLASRGLLA